MIEEYREIIKEMKLIEILESYPADVVMAIEESNAETEQKIAYLENEIMMLEELNG